MRPVLLLAFLLPLVVRAEELRLKDGTVYRQARVAQVMPDGVIVSHETGSAKIDYEQLQPVLRTRYGIDPKKAAIFRTTEAQRARETAAEDLRLVKAQHERDVARIRELTAQLGEGGQFSYGGNPEDVSLARAARAARAAMEAEIEMRRASALVPQTFWTAPFWDSTPMRILGALLGGGKGGPSAAQTGPRGEGPFSSSRFDAARQ